MIQIIVNAFVEEGKKSPLWKCSLPVPTMKK